MLVSNLAQDHYTKPTWDIQPQSGEQCPYQIYILNSEPETWATNFLEARARGEYLSTGSIDL